MANLVGNTETNNQLQLERLCQTLDEVDIKWFRGDRDQRAEVLLKARALCRRLETGWDRICSAMYEEPMSTVAIAIAMELDLFRALCEGESDSKTTQQLSEMVHADIGLTRRILRSLASTSAIHQVDVDAFTVNDFCRKMVTPEGKGAMSFHFRVRTPTLAGITEYFRIRGFHEPSGLADCPWKLTQGHQETWFDWLQAHPQLLNEFGLTMSGFATSRPAWHEFYPVERLFNDYDGSAPVLVDVGGGIGDQLGQFLVKYPQTAGQLVLQDLPDVLRNARGSEDAIKKVPYDMFTPQVTKGARAYFMRFILHDWPDEKAREILINTRLGMRPGYSRLLVNEMVIDPSSPAPFATAMDLIMMTFMGGKERTEEDWESLFKGAGLKLVGRWKSAAADRDVLEAEIDGEEFENPK